MENIIIVRSEDEFKFIKNIHNCQKYFGVSSKIIIREYAIKGLTKEEAFKFWYEYNLITLEEYNYIN